MNQSLKFTTGPWQILQSDGFLQIAAYGDIATGIASVYARNGVSAMHANAQLIAAAPELLEAAIALFNDASDRDEVIDHDNVGDGEVMYADWAALKKAIDKATGATA